MTNLKELSTAELEAELKRRNDEELERLRVAKENRMTQLQVLTENPAALELFKLLLPDHSRNTCKTDDDYINVGRCTRCTVLQAFETQDVEVLYNLRLTL